MAVITGIFTYLERPSASPPTSQLPDTTADLTGKILQRIDFNYFDSPLNHGWQVDETVQITFTSETDGYVGKYLIIQSNDDYAMDTYVQPEALSGTHLNFVSQYDSGVIYTHVLIRGQDASIVKEGWLQFSRDLESIEQLDDAEWQVPVEAIPQGGGWSRSQIDLVDAVRKTFGNQGWQFAQIDRIRIRGNIVLASIEIEE